MRNFAFAIALAGLVVPMQQVPPSTEVFLTALTAKGSIPPGYEATWINISNSPGYDNQPSFLPDSGAVLFTSNRDGKQTDIYRYDIVAKRLTQLTDTPESEYSPTMTPDGNDFSVVRVEADGAQRLWRFDLHGTRPRLILENVKPVGYHAWIDATHLALFVLGSGDTPATLQIADTTTGKAQVVATGIGRSVLVRPGTGTVSYMTTGEKRIVREYDPKTGTSRDLFAPLTGSQDAVWAPDGKFLWMATGTVISMANPETVAKATASMAVAADRAKKAGLPFQSPVVISGWVQVTNLATHISDDRSPRVASITRLAISPDGRWLAFVVAEPVAK